MQRCSVGGARECAGPCGHSPRCEMRRCRAGDARECAGPCGHSLRCKMRRYRASGARERVGPWTPGPLLTERRRHFDPLPSRLCAIVWWCICTTALLVAQSGYDCTRRDLVGREWRPRTTCPERDSRTQQFDYPLQPWTTTTLLRCMHAFVQCL